MKITENLFIFLLMGVYMDIRENEDKRNLLVVEKNVHFEVWERSFVFVVSC